MATLSSAAPAWARAKYGSSSPASNATSFGGGRRGMNARKYDRSPQAAASRAQQAWAEQQQQNGEAIQDRRIGEGRAWQEKIHNQDKIDAQAEKRGQWDNIIGGQQQGAPQQVGQQSVNLAASQSAGLGAQGLNNRIQTLGDGVVGRNGVNVDYANGATIQPLQVNNKVQAIQKGLTLQTPNGGTGMATFPAPNMPRQPATFEGKTAAEFFQTAANEQKRGNLYAQPLSTAPATPPPANVSVGTVATAPVTPNQAFSGPVAAVPQLGNASETVMGGQQGAAIPNVSGVSAINPSGSVTDTSPRLGAAALAQKTTPLQDMAKNAIQTAGSTVGGAMGQTANILGRTNANISNTVANTPAAQLLAKLSGTYKGLTTPR